MTDEPIITVSGLRGIVGSTLTPEVARRYATAFAGTLPDGPMVVTRDGRANGLDLVDSVVAGLNAGGARPVLDGGIAATPTTGVLVRHHDCVGGVQISASHNPAEYNGLKLFSSTGRVVPADVGRRVLERYRAADPGPGIGSEIVVGPHFEVLSDTVSAHFALLERLVDFTRIRACQFRVLLDANHGAGSVLGQVLLDELNCEETILGGEPDGAFAHQPEPTAENLRSVSAEVKRAGAAIGFCQDPDADRLAIIDEHGHYLGEEYTLAICASHVLSRRSGPVVTNCSTSRMTEDVAHRHGVPFYRSAVGEANVVDEMLARGAVFGGEGNGGVIDPRVGLVRDSFVAIALVLEAMATRGMPVSALADELPRYAICKTKIDLPRDRIPAALDALERHFTDGTVSRLDGLRLDWQRDDGSASWLLVRPSNTEPIVRAIAEAPTAELARQLCDEAAQVIGLVR